MKMLILGGEGMLGHRLLLELGARHEARVTLRRPLPEYAHHGLFDAGNATGGVDVCDLDAVRNVLRQFRPDVVFNAVGIVKQRDAAADSIASIRINALLPHQLAALCAQAGSRFVHMSTDCVFAGTRGGYTEDDLPDAADLYGRSKVLGEVREGGCLTLRTSIIGLELANRHGLVEWFLRQSGEIRGFRRAIFSGFTTSVLARLLERLAVAHADLTGLWHVASSPISKHDLLVDLARRLGRSDIRIVADDEFVCDRSLDGSRFAAVTGWVAPAWDEMLGELARQIERRDANDLRR